MIAVFGTNITERVVRLINIVLIHLHLLGCQQRLAHNRLCQNPAATSNQRHKNLFLKFISIKSDWARGGGGLYLALRCSASLVEDYHPFGLRTAGAIGCRFRIFFTEIDSKKPV